MADALGESFDCAAPEERIRAALRSLVRAGLTLLAQRTGLPPDVVRRALADLRARGEVVHEGRGRGTEYRLAGDDAAGGDPR
jgi:predicted ArsR family transcriptional regulator